MKQYAIIYKRTVIDEEIDKLEYLNIASGELKENYFQVEDGKRYPDKEKSIINNSEYLHEVIDVHDEEELKEFIKQKGEFKKNNSVLFFKKNKKIVVLKFDESEDKIYDDVYDQDENYATYDIGSVIEMINKYVLFQEDAIKKVVCALFMKYNDNMQSNMILNGPNSVGKKRSIEYLTTILNIPCLTINLDILERVEGITFKPEYILHNLIAKANGDISIAENGVIIFENLHALQNNPTVLQSLGILLNEEPIEISNGDEHEVIDTKNITFVIADDFYFLGKVNKSESGYDNNLSFNKLIEWGYPKSFINKFNYIINYNELSSENIKSILKNPLVQPMIDYFLIAENGGYELLIADIVYDKIIDIVKYNGYNMLDLIKLIDRIFLDSFVPVVYTTNNISKVEIVDLHYIDNNYKLIMNINKNNERKKK